MNREELSCNESIKHIYKPYTLAHAKYLMYKAFTNRTIINLAAIIGITTLASLGAGLGLGASLACGLFGVALLECSR